MALARRDEGAYREYSTPVRSGPTQAASGCSARRMQLDFHDGLLGRDGRRTAWLCNRHLARTLEGVDSSRPWTCAGDAAAPA